MDILRLFFDCDEGCQDFLPRLTARQLPAGKPHRRRASGLSTSQVMTLVILFETSGLRNFKTFSTQRLLSDLRAEFPGALSDQRCVELQASAVIPRAAFLDSRLGNCRGLSFVDATRSAICHHRPSNSHKVLCGVAKRGQTSGGRCSGCKLHLVIKDCGALLAVVITPGQVDHRRPVAGLSRKLWGQLLGDRGSSSQE